MDCGLCSSAGELWVRKPGVGKIREFSHESEHDLALMVSDFLENGSGGAESWCSSDSDSGLPDLAHIADKISFHRRSVDQYESDILSVVHSLMLSIRELGLHPVKSAPCKASCIRFSLVKLLRISGYDAAVCSSRWQSSGKVPGGDHEYIDVVNYDDSRSFERLIIDIDFQSHFEIARAVDTYDKILKSLPVVYVGNLSKLKRFLQAMSEAAKVSLRQNLMPLPPWRSLPYLQAKWQSPYQRLLNLDEQNTGGSFSSEQHMQCCDHLRRLQCSLRSEIEANRMLNPLKC